MQQSLRLVTRIYLKLAAVALSVGFILRIVLLLNEQTLDTGFGLGEWMRIFLLGALNDWMALTVGFVFLWLFLTSI
ncbi:MAG: LTA synthase family protein, partial [Alistipes sp.]